MNKSSILTEYYMLLISAAGLRCLPPSARELLVFASAQPGCKHQGLLCVQLCCGPRRGQSPLIRNPAPKSSRSSTCLQSRASSGCGQVTPSSRQPSCEVMTSHLSSQGVGLGFSVRGTEGLRQCGLREAGDSRALPSRCHPSS